MDEVLGLVLRWRGVCLFASSLAYGEDYEFVDDTINLSLLLVSVDSTCSSGASSEVRRLILAAEAWHSQLPHIIDL